MVSRPGAPAQPGRDGPVHGADPVVAHAHGHGDSLTVQRDPEVGYERGEGIPFQREGSPLLADPLPGRFKVDFYITSKIDTLNVHFSN